jgi:ATP-binding cassette subfamily C protein CydD
MIDKRLLKEGLRYQRQAFAVIGFGVASACGAILQAYLLTTIIQAVFLAGKGLSDVVTSFSWLILLIIIRAVVIWAGETAAYSLAGKVKQDLRHRLLTQLFALGPLFVMKEQSGELINTLTGGIENIEEYFTKFLPGIVMAGLVPALMLAFVLPFDWMSALLMVVTAPLIPFFMILIGQWANKLNQEQWEVLSRLSSHLLDVLQGLTTLKVFGRSREQVPVIARLSDEFRSKTLQVLKVAFLSALVLELIATISTALIAVTVGLKLLYGKMLFTEAFFVLLLAPEFYSPLRQLGSHFHAAMSGTSAAERIYQLLAEPLPAMAADEQPLPLSRQVAIEFRKVSFAYQDKRAVDTVSFLIKPGKKVAIVGVSGSGKSTISRLLLRLIQPTAGSILVNGQRLDQIRLADWRTHIAYVPQAPHLFHGTVADNVCFGLVRNRAEIITACKQAEADQFISDLTQGYDTVIGEGGQPLSGGQAQRIALARAFLKDAPVLILDEATAGLDLATEAVLRQTFAKLMENRTVLFIAHRLSTVRQADQIIVLRGGKVSEQGTHHELLALGKEYAQLIAAYRGAQ